MPDSYLRAFPDSIAWLASFSYKGQPLSLNASQWGGGIPEAPKESFVAPRSKETITTPAGTFNTTVVSWKIGQVSRIWVLDDFPFPVKADVYNLDVPQTKNYAFELLESGVNPKINNQSVEQQYPLIVGTITETGCRVLDGNIVALLSNDQYINTCKYESKSFLITYVSFCNTEREGSWMDPDSGKSFVFGNSCDAPRIPKNPCEYPYTYVDATIPVRLYHEQIVVNDRIFFVTVNISETTCQWISFDSSRPSIKIEVDDVENVKGYLNVTIPAELLSGNFTLLVNGLPRDYYVKTADGYSTISFTQQYHYTGSRPHDRIEIIGTSTVPEFQAILGST